MAQYCAACLLRLIPLFIKHFTTLYNNLFSHKIFKDQMASKTLLNKS